MTLNPETILAVGEVITITILIYNIVFNSGKKETAVSDRVSILERGFEKTSKDIETIKTNHLQHMQEDIKNIQLNLVEINTTLKIKFNE